MELTDKEEKMKRKAQKDFPEFTDIADRLTSDDLEKKLLEYAKYREETLQAQSKDDELNKAKEQVSYLNGPYKDTLGALKLKSAYIHLLLQELKEVSNGEETQVG